MATAQPIEVVLEDMQWLRRFAVRLTRDEDHADDLVQETLVEAWRKPPADTRHPLRPWLASVLRNRGKMARRTAQRRQRRHDEAATRTGAPTDPEADHARLQVLTMLMQQLRDLPEQDQWIVMRRYFDGDSAVEIAAALDIPAATVRSRLHRSLKRIRAGLDDACGGRSAWCAAVLPLADGGATLLPPAASKGSMSLTSKLVLGAIAVTAGTALFLRPDADASVDASTPGANVGAHAPGSTALASPSTPARETIAKGDATPTPAPTAQQRWQQRRDAIATAIDRSDQDVAEATARARRKRSKAYRELVNACVADIDASAVGAITLSLRGFGAPGVGWIYEQVDIAHTGLDDPQLLECLVESMYAFVGDAPSAPEQGVTNVTIPIGKPATPEQDATQKTQYIFGAHVSEVRVCGAKAGDPRGEVAYTVAIKDGDVVGAEPGPTPLPAEVTDCITERILDWRFPEDLGPITVRGTFKLPVPGRAPGPTG